MQYYYSARIIKVKSILNPPRCKCDCGSWLNHWAKITHRQAFSCNVLGCTAMATDGGHVIRIGLSNRALSKMQYVVPMCKRHASMKGEIFEVKPKAYLSWANVRYTCKAIKEDYEYST